MFKQLSLAGAALVTGATALVPATPAAAQRYYDRGAYHNGYDGAGYNNGESRGYQERSYRDDYRYSDRGYRARRCSDGAGGTVIGAIAGGLLGNTVAGRGDHLFGTVLGAGAGALAGRAIDRSGQNGYCRR